MRPEVLENEVEEVLKICNGDALSALRITLIANAFLEAEVDQRLDEIAGLEIQIARLTERKTA